MASNNLKFTISAVDKTKQAFNGVKRGLGAVTSAVFSFKGALAGAVGIGGLGLLIKNSLEAVDRIGKLSKVVGISTKDLQTFKLAAEIGGMQLDSFTKGAKRFIDNIGDFADGVGEAKVTFEKLGITQKDILPIQNDTTALLGLVADKLNQVEDGALKSKYAIEIFGGRGSELINVLAGGSEQLRKFAEESKKFGSLSDAQVRSVEAFNDSIVRLKTVFGNLVNKIVADLSPVLLKFSDDLRNKVLESLKNGDDVSKNFAFSLVSTAEAFALLASQAAVSANNIAKFGSNLIDLFNIKALFTGESFDKTFKSFEKLPTAISPELQKRFDAIRQSIENIATNTEKTDDNISKTTSKLGEAKRKIEGIHISISEIADKFLIKANAEFQKINDTIATGILSGIQSISQGLAEAIVLGKKLEDIFRNIAQKILIQIIQKQIEERIVKLVNIGLEKLKELILNRQKKQVDEHLTLQRQKNNALKTELAIQTAIAAVKLFSGSGGGGGGGIPFFADGGRIGANQPAIVGERGKELFIPDTSGTIVPNNKVRDLGSTTNVNFTINATDVKGVKELLIDNRSTIVNIINGALNQKGKAALV